MLSDRSLGGDKKNPVTMKPVQMHAAAITTCESFDDDQSVRQARGATYRMGTAMPSGSKASTANTRNMRKQVIRSSGHFLPVLREGVKVKCLFCMVFPGLSFVDIRSLIEDSINLLLVTVALSTRDLRQQRKG
jgi:hypothetical protein